jgi:hypothetical protein
MHAYTWYVCRKAPRSGPSLKVRVGKDELMAFLAALNLLNAFPSAWRRHRRPRGFRGEERAAGDLIASSSP